MLKTRNLDDQTYAEIVEAARGRLPWLCPQWTDHNSTDPGITLIELMAWYKELQQYQMNRVTDTLKLKLLKLVGAVPRPASPARCAVEIRPDAPPRLQGERLYTQEGIPFELLSAVTQSRRVIARVCVRSGEREMDISEMAGERPVTFLPFELDGERAVLRIGFSRVGEGTQWLWFDVDEPAGVDRNPFADEWQTPRNIRWICEGAQGTLLIEDNTHALSRDGYVGVQPVGEWPVGEDGLYWMTLRLEDPGCEERVRLSAISAERYRVVQRETWASTRRFCVPKRSDWHTDLTDALGRDGQLAVFLRTGEGWEQTDRWQTETGPQGRRVCVDSSTAVQDGEENLLILCLDPLRSGELLFDARGLPGETFFLRLEGRKALTEHFSLLCNTLYRDGKVRPALWRCVDDFYPYGPRDRVFIYNAARETITFGDGEHGALLQGGPGAVLAAELTVSYCALGNIPSGVNLCFDDGVPLRNTAADGGADRENVSEVQARLLKELSQTRKCVSVQDYERLAKLTPGLRVAAAKAIPAFDPDEPTGVCRTPTVTVVVVPDGAGDRPMPDRRFLDTVQKQLDDCRPIGTCVKVIAPVYVDIDVDVSLRGGEGGVRDTLTRAIREYLSLDQVGIGGIVRADDVGALVQTAPGVLQVRQVSLHAAGAGCTRSVDGDIRLPKQGIACLRGLRAEKLSVERLGR